MIKDITTNASDIECFTPPVTGWYLMSVHEDSNAIQPDGSTAASLTFSSAVLTIKQRDITLDGHDAIAAAQTKVVALVGGVPVRCTCASGSSHKVRIEAIEMQIA